ncbi:MAG: DNA polymerase III subunit delta' [Hyphomicrobiaceae bacterium]|nr:DNA polymerase III subunit delta' [Hyphomicrobiaceae bacterium]
MARAPVLLEMEPLPEADRLEGFPHPRQTRRLFGHAPAERELAKALASGRIHHAWLLAGPEGVGKATLAYRFAAYALASAGERDPARELLALPEQAPAARMVRALSHPGLLVIRRPWIQKDKRFAATITIDEVRRLRAFLAHTAGGGERQGEPVQRVIIVDQADELNLSSANALLKSLEEPPPRTLFLLVTSQPGRLLPTIRSRCRMLALAPLGGGDLRQSAEQALAATEIEPPREADWPRLMHHAHGSVRRLLSLATGDGLKLVQRIDAILTNLPKVDWAAAHGLADDLAGAVNEQRFETFFDLLLDLAARIVRAAATGEGEPDEVELARRLIPEGRLASWAELWETVVREKAEAVALNLDRKSLVLETLSRLEGVSRR